jgi:cytochrome P450
MSSLLPLFQTSLLALLALLLLRLLYYAISKSRADAKFKSFALANHCEEPPLRHNRLPYGVDRLVGFITFKGDILEDFIRKQYITEGWTFKFNGLLGEVISTVDPQNLQTLLSLRFADYELGSKRRKNFADLLGNGIFTADGPEWEHSRAFLRPQFSREQVSDLDAMERHVQNLFRAIEPTDEGMWTQDVDLQELFYRFTLDTATEFLFGESTESQLAGLARKGGKDEGEFPITTAVGSPDSEMDFARAFRTAQDYLDWQLRFPESAIPFLHLPISSSYRNYVHARNTVHRFANHYVNLALHPELRARGTAHSPRRFVMLEALAEITQDRDELRDQLLHVLIAGRDSVATLLSWSFVLLSQQPKILTSLRTAILSTFGTTASPEISFSSLKNCRPLTHFLLEVLRLYPILPLNFRVATQDTVLPTGGGKDRKSPIAVRKGQVIAFSVYVMHRRPDIWGEDADVFRPERWEGRKIGWEYLPFNGGPRICLGREYSPFPRRELIFPFNTCIEQFALTEAAYVIVRLLQRFSKIENILPPEQALSKALTLTLLPAKGLKVRLYRD